MTPFLSRAEDILEIATAGSSDLSDVLMVLDRQGGFRMIEPAGWSLPAVAVEFGAEVVYKMERRGSSVRVEGWNGSERCLLQNRTTGDRACSLPGAPIPPQATMLQFRARALA